MRLTKRDQQLIQLICSCRLLTAKQIQIALFPLKHDSRCQLRLTLLRRNHYIDIMPNMLVNQPAIYCISRKCRNSFNLLREYWDDETIRSYMIAPGSIQHLLGINEIRTRILRACSELKFKLLEWHRSEELAPVLKDDGIVPDGYFKIQRLVDGEPRTGAFFLELQRSDRSRQILKSKIERYARLYDSGKYQKIFNTRALRVLFVFTSEYGTNINHRINMSLDISRDMGMELIRSASLEQIRAGEISHILTGALWHHPKETKPIALY
jgi:hypothetical protein